MCPLLSVLRVPCLLLMNETEWSPLSCLHAPFWVPVHTFPAGAHPAQGSSCSLHGGRQGTGKVLVKVLAVGGICFYVQKLLHPSVSRRWAPYASGGF